MKNQEFLACIMAEIFNGWLLLFTIRTIVTLRQIQVIGRSVCVTPTSQWYIKS
jgi:hypothetical protein